MAITRKWVYQASAITVASTELNGLAAGGLNVASTNQNNTQGQANLDGYTRALFLMNLALTTGNYAANSTLDVWLLREVPMTSGTFEDGSSSVTPARPPDFSFALQASSAAQKQAQDVRLPPGTFGILFRNNQSTGTQALAATGNTITMVAYTDSGV